MEQQLLTVKNISKHFAGIKALNDISISIGQGEIVCLAGENGSGKSTLIKVIAGVLTPDEGEIIINEKTFKQLHPIDSIREGIQIIYQDFSLFPNLTVAENIALNYQLSHNKRIINWQQVHDIASEALKMIGVDIDLNAVVEDLSVADKQLIAICRSLLQNAKLIIMDEPTTALTKKEVKSLLNIIRSLKERGISIIFVSHKLDEVLEVSDKIVVLRNGKKVAEGNAVDFDTAKLIYHMTGRKLSNSSYSFTPDPDEQSLLKVEKLCSNSFTGISFELFPGEIVGIAGLLGSGRNELAKALFGLYPVDDGKIFIEGKQCNISCVQDAIQHGIGYVSEDRLTEGLFRDQSINSNIIISIIDSLTTKFNLIDPTKVKDQTANWIQELNIVAPSGSLPVQNLSGGNQQRVVLARWLATKPRILILNGPTVGVDIGSKTDIHSIIKNLAGHGMGVIIISDDLPELLQNCNRILLMQKGQIVEQFQGTVSEKELAKKLTGA